MILSYANDVPVLDSTMLIQYADDTTLLGCIPSFSLHSPLQEHLSHIEHWVSANHLKISTAKCATMPFNSSRMVDPPMYYLDSLPLPVTDSLSILGVTFTCTLDFPLHVSSPAHAWIC